MNIFFSCLVDRFPTRLDGIPNRVDGFPTMVVGNPTTLVERFLTTGIISWHWPQLVPKQLLISDVFPKCEGYREVDPYLYWLHSHCYTIYLFLSLNLFLGICFGLIQYMKVYKLCIITNFSRLYVLFIDQMVMLFVAFSHLINTT